MIIALILLLLASPLAAQGTLKKGDTLALIVRRSGNVTAPDSAAVYNALGRELDRLGYTIWSRPNPRFGNISVHLSVFAPTVLPTYYTYAVTIDREVFSERRQQWVSVWSRLNHGVTKRTTVGEIIRNVRGLLPSSVKEM